MYTVALTEEEQAKKNAISALKIKVMAAANPRRYGVSVTK